MCQPVHACCSALHLLGCRYDSGDGRPQKATIEHIFRPSDNDVNGDEDTPSTSGGSDASGAAAPGSAPWMVGWQMSERNVVSGGWRMRSKHFSMPCYVYKCAVHVLDSLPACTAPVIFTTVAAAERYDLVQYCTQQRQGYRTHP